jgi:hypothetical protein
LASGPLGSVAGDPDRHRGWLLCPSSVPAAAGRGLRPRVFSAPRPDPQFQVHARPGTGCNSPARPLTMRLQTGPTPLLQAIFTVWPDLVPIQTGTPAQIRAADRSSGTPAVLPGRYVASVDHTGLLRRPARCSVITQRSHMQQRPSSANASVSACIYGLVLCGSSAGQSRRKNGLYHPGREPCMWLSACRRREKRPSSSTR